MASDDRAIETVKVTFEAESFSKDGIPMTVSRLDQHHILRFTTSFQKGRVGRQETH